MLGRTGLDRRFVKFEDVRRTRATNLEIGRPRTGHEVVVSVATVERVVAGTTIDGGVCRAVGLEDVISALERNVEAGATSRGNGRITADIDGVASGPREVQAVIACKLKEVVRAGYIEGCISVA